ncbi:MAG: cob(I)yrinic acid a,c-diamide adenosyltransferase [Thaumarchaeota archaeon]|nr:cob(I)yrinic acid a,c-diamide adenosyltransferase [Nitrososphaerota archaeon]
MYTRGGDRGETGLYGSKRVAKDSRRVEAYGTVDELNSCIGVAVSSSGRGEVSEQLRWVQGRLFVAGADLASERPLEGQPDRVPRIGKKDTERLEAMVDRFQTELPRLTKFILPGGSALSANLHLARSVCRRAERTVVSLAKSEDVNPELVPFLNRLSTYLFNAARYGNLLEGVKDEVWESG